MVKAILFDWDETLAHTRSAVVEALEFVLKKSGYYASLEADNDTCEDRKENLMELKNNLLEIKTTKEALEKFLREQGSSIKNTEVMTVDDDFSVSFMQSGRGEKYLKAFMEELRAQDIPVRLVGEERYTLCDTCLPE